MSALDMGLPVPTMEEVEAHMQGMAIGHQHVGIDTPDAAEPAEASDDLTASLQEMVIGGGEEEIAKVRETWELGCIAQRHQQEQRQTATAKVGLEAAVEALVEAGSPQPLSGGGSPEWAKELYSDVGRLQFAFFNALAAQEATQGAAEVVHTADSYERRDRCGFGLKPDQFLGFFGSFVQGFRDDFRRERTVNARVERDRARIRALVAEHGQQRPAAQEAAAARTRSRENARYPPELGKTWGFDPARDAPATRVSGLASYVPPVRAQRKCYIRLACSHESFVLTEEGRKPLEASCLSCSYSTARPSMLARMCLLVVNLRTVHKGGSWPKTVSRPAQEAP